ncbi:MAG: hypothetical protein KA419_13015 [Acidobacteria bacterium]|nr:hypothetical protein [Acidobacteriota bacterium]
MTGIDLEANEGAKLLKDICGAPERYDLSVGSTVETRGGSVNVAPIQNLDANIDNRYNYRRPPGKTATELPQVGIDDQVAINLEYYVSTTTRQSLTNLQVPVDYTIYFHELAEAYEKIHNNSQYAQAHVKAHERERKMRDQRPILKQNNFGSGGQENSQYTPANRATMRR